MVTEKKGKKTRKETPEERPEYRFSKEQLLSSGRFQSRRDILNALLLPDKAYTVAEAEELIEAYRKGKVK